MPNIKREAEAILHLLTSRDPELADAMRLIVSRLRSGGRPDIMQVDVDEKYSIVKVESDPEASDAHD